MPLIQRKSSQRCEPVGLATSTPEEEEKGRQRRLAQARLDRVTSPTFDCYTASYAWQEKARTMETEELEARLAGLERDLPELIALVADPPSTWTDVKWEAMNSRVQRWLGQKRAITSELHWRATVGSFSLRGLTRSTSSPPLDPEQDPFAWS